MNRQFSPWLRLEQKSVMQGAPVELIALDEGLRFDLDQH
ncbi:MAG: hypothetical protein ACI82F_003072 [Planctomycetota bacterium]|jgi:hypothetical protein